MLEFDDTQIRSFGHAVALSRTQRLGRIAAQAWPHRVAEVGQEGFDTLVDTALGRASDYGFKSDRDLLRCLNIALTLGPDFDRDGRFPWAPALLEADMPTDRKLDSLGRRVQTLLASGTDPWQPGGRDG